MVRRQKRLHINVLELKTVTLALKLQFSVPKSDIVDYHGQFSGSPYKQGNVCQAHSTVPKCDDRLTVHADTDPVDRMVNAPSGVPGDLSESGSLLI